VSSVSTRSVPGSRSFGSLSTRPLQPVRPFQTRPLKVRFELTAFRGPKRSEIFFRTPSFRPRVSTLHSAAARLTHAAAVRALVASPRRRAPRLAADDPARARSPIRPPATPVDR
jgi:hypothetical protein